MNDNMIIITAVVIVVLLGLLIYGVATKPFFPKTMRVQNDAPFMVGSGVWVGCENMNYLAPGDGIRHFGGGFFVIDKKYTGALVTVNIETNSSNLLVKFVGRGGAYGDFEQEFARINGFGSGTWQVQTINDFYLIKVMNIDPEPRQVTLCRMSVQVNR